MATAPVLPAGTPAPVGRWVAGVQMYKDLGATQPVSSNGDQINLWKDLSGNGFDLTVTSGQSAPTYNPAPNYFGQPATGTYPSNNPFLGTGAASFDGATMGLTNASFRPCPNGTSNPITWMIVCQQNAGSNTAVTIGIGDGENMAVVVGHANTQFSTALASGSGAVAAAPTRFGPRGVLVRYDPTQSTFATQCAIHDGFSNLSLSGSPFPPRGSMAAGVYIGYDPGLGLHYWPGVVLEVACWNSALTDTQLQALDRYMASTYFWTGFTHWHFAGDSITKGYSGNQNDDPSAYGTGSASSYPLKVWHMLYGTSGNGSMVDVGAVGYTVGLSVAGSPGSIQNNIANFNTYRDPYAQDIVVLEGGTNDIDDGQTDTQTIASIQAMCTTVATTYAYPIVILWTIPRRGDWPLGAGPYGGISGGTWTNTMESYRLSVNSWIRASAVSGGFCNAVYDPENMGVTTPNDGVLYLPDMLHFTDAGYTKHAVNVITTLFKILGRGGPVAPTEKGGKA